MSEEPLNAASVTFIFVEREGSTQEEIPTMKINMHRTIDCLHTFEMLSTIGGEKCA